MIKNFNSADVYMIAGLYFIHANSSWLGAATICLAVFDAIACISNERKKGQP